MAETAFPSPLPWKQTSSNYLFYGAGGWTTGSTATLDVVLNNVAPLLAKGEASINQELSDLAAIDPGQLDQSRLLQAQVNLSRWQIASQLLSNFSSGVASGLKNTLQNIGR